MPKSGKRVLCYTLRPPNSVLFLILTRLQVDFQEPGQTFSSLLRRFVGASLMLCVRAGPHKELGSQAPFCPQMP